MDWNTLFSVIFIIIFVMMIMRCGGMMGGCGGGRHSGGQGGCAAKPKPGTHDETPDNEKQLPQDKPPA